MISAQRDLGGSNDFRMMVDELGRAFVIRHLAISRQQLAAWLLPNAQVPRASVLALYWETHWGRSLIDSDRHNELDLLRGLVRCHKETIATLRQRVAILEAELRVNALVGLSANERWFDCAQSDPRRARDGQRMCSPGAGRPGLPSKSAPGGPQNVKFCTLTLHA